MTIKPKRVEADYWFLPLYSPSYPDPYSCWRKRDSLLRKLQAHEDKMQTVLRNLRLNREQNLKAKRTKT